MNFLFLKHVEDEINKLQKLKEGSMILRKITLTVRTSQSASRAHTCPSCLSRQCTYTIHICGVT